MKSDLKISYPGSKKTYVSGVIHPSVKVGMRVVTQMPTVTIKDGEKTETPNQPIYIYDTSGPYGDDNIDIKAYLRLYSKDDEIKQLEKKKKKELPNLKKMAAGINVFGALMK